MMRMKKLLAILLLALIACTAAAFAEETQWRTDWQRLAGVDYAVKMPEGYYLLNKHTKEALLNDTKAYKKLKRAQGEDFLTSILADRKNAIMSDDGRLCVRFDLMEYNSDIVTLRPLFNMWFASKSEEMKANGWSILDCNLFEAEDVEYANQIIYAFGQGASVSEDVIDGHFLMCNNSGVTFEFWAYSMDRKAMEEILNSFIDVEPLPEVLDRSIPIYATFEDTPSLNREDVWEDRLTLIRNELGVSITGEAANYKSPNTGELQLPSVIDGLPVVQIWKDAFRRCGCYSSITVPASIQRICSGAFSEMDALTQVVLEDGVMIIEDSFNQCPQLMRVCIPASVERISENAFDLRNSYFHFEVEKGSYAEQYAKEHSIPYTYAKDRDGVSLSRGNTVTFGTHDGAEIEWQVLKVEDNQALLLAKNVLDTQPYSTAEDVRWYNSEIRKYLNDELLFELFSAEELENISSHRIYDPASPYILSGVPGIAVFCRMFLLSYFEARDWLPEDAHRAAEEDWWLRTTYSSQDAHVVSAEGEMRGGVYFRELHGVRPAIWVRTDQAEGILKIVDDGVWVEETPVPNDGVIRKGTVVRMGTYEQDGDLENGAEPIRWIVLNVYESSALIITQDCIDVHSYDTSGAVVGWSDTELRHWLNNDFLHEAFTDTERAAMIETEVGNQNWDLVWILNADEVGSYFPYWEDRLAYVTEYAAERGAIYNNEGYGMWLLRTDKNYDRRADIMVPYQGCLSGANDRRDVCIRPVVCVDLEKSEVDEWEITPTPTPAPTPEPTAEPTVEPVEAPTPKPIPVIDPMEEGLIPGTTIVPRPTAIPTPTSAPMLNSDLATMEGVGFTEPADGITIQVGKKLPLAWTEIPGAKCYSVEAYPAGTPSYNFSWMTILYDGETSVVIPRSTLTEPSYTIELNAWKDDRLTGGREIFTASITVYTENKFADPAGSAN